MGLYATKNAKINDKTDHTFEGSNILENDNKKNRVFKKQYRQIPYLYDTYSALYALFTQQFKES
ncbi:hypothetical protein BJB63x_001140 [Bartonella sp. JB63]|nr:hypothetical protein BJB15x_001160 [Bartonella sp. JB15]AQX28814.1 hypothetical protein BJB63x_001140 [Bartonella sp. JB63]